MEERIISISGKPGLYKLMKQGRGMLIVESVDDKHQRFSVGMHDKVVSLNDISIYCEEEDEPLISVFNKVKTHENGEALKFNPRKIETKELREYFAQVLPEYDPDRVHDSDIRKLLVWYDLLIKGGINDFEEENPKNPPLRKKRRRNKFHDGAKRRAENITKKAENL